MLSLSCFRNCLKSISFFILAGWLSCKPHAQESLPSGYYNEEGMFAYGQVILAPVQDGSELLLKAKTAVYSLDNEERRIYEIESYDGQESRPVMFVDYLINETFPVIYKHTVVTRASKSDPSKLDIWVKLRTAVLRSRASKYIYVGRSTTDELAGGVKIKLYRQVMLSLIAYGEQQGQLALHYADDSIRAKPYSAEYCAVLRNLSEHLRYQIPSDFDPNYCVSSKPNEDICDSKPGEPDCYPVIPDKIAGFDKQGLNLKGHNLLEIGHSQFRLVGDESMGAAILERDGKTYPLGISDQLVFHVRTSENRQHKRCRVWIDYERSQSADKLFVAIQFLNDAERYEDKVCNVIVEDITTGDTDLIQVVKK